LGLTWCASLCDGGIVAWLDRWGQVEYTCQQLLAFTKRQGNGVDKKGWSTAWNSTVAKAMEGFRMLKCPFDDEATHFQKG
jgi:hypothetical protein